MARRRRRAMTLIEILVVIMVIGVLIAMLLPAIQASRAVARRTACANNQWQVGRGFHELPLGSSDHSRPELSLHKGCPLCEQADSIWVCPELPPDQTISFAFNYLPPRYQPDESNYVVLLDGNQCTIALTLADMSWIPIVADAISAWPTCCISTGTSTTKSCSIHKTPRRHLLLLESAELVAALLEQETPATALPVAEPAPAVSGGASSSGVRRRQQQLGWQRWRRTIGAVPMRRQLPVHTG